MLLPQIAVDGVRLLLRDDAGIQQAFHRVTAGSVQFLKECAALRRRHTAHVGVPAVDLSLLVSGVFLDGVGCGPVDDAGLRQDVRVKVLGGAVRASADAAGLKKGLPLRIGSQLRRLFKLCVPVRAPLLPARYP